MNHANAFAQNSLTPGDGSANPNYRLSVRDRISISVFDEPKLALAQGIDAKGKIKMPLIGVFRVEGMTIRDVENILEHQYVEQKILRRPIVTLDVLLYSPKEVPIWGPGIARAGQVSFPPEVGNLEIVELISMAGGFTRLARRKDVKVTRILSNGSQIVLSVNVEEMIESRKKNRNTETTYIYPGDLLFVDEVFFKFYI